MGGRRESLTQWLQPRFGLFPGVTEPCPLLPSLRVLEMYKTPTPTPASSLGSPSTAPWALPFLPLSPLPSPQQGSPFSF